jgi:hypothetical protein
MYDPVIHMEKLVPSADRQYIDKLNKNSSLGYMNKINSATTEEQKTFFQKLILKKLVSSNVAEKSHMDPEKKLHVELMAILKETKKT